MENSCDLLEEVVVRVPLMEPAGGFLEFSGRALCENTLLVGNIGSGKTGILNHFLQQSIAFRADNPQRKIGLFVFDSKTDGTTERVLRWAEEAGRSADVVVLSETSQIGYDPFAGASQLADLERITAKFSAADPGKDEINAYWNQTRDAMIEAALTHHLLLYNKLELAPTLQWLARLLLANSSIAEADLQSIKLFSDTFESVRPKINPHLATRLEAGVRQLELWNRLDFRTRGILASIVGNVLRPWLSFSASKFLCQKGRPAVRIADVIDQGKVIVLKLNAAANPDLAAVLGRMLKSDLYEAIQQRQPTIDSTDRLVGLFFDEYPLVATGNRQLFGDLQNLQTMREKRAFVVAATQGYISMRNAVGRADWEGLKVNFTNLIFLRSHESDVESHARSIFGRGLQKNQVNIRINELDENSHGIIESHRLSRTMRTEGEEWIIQPGSLSRLDPHQAFFANGAGERLPCWIAPLHLNVSLSLNDHGNHLLRATQTMIHRALKKATAKTTQPLKLTQAELSQAISILQKAEEFLKTTFFGHPVPEFLPAHWSVLADIMLEVLEVFGFHADISWHQLQPDIGDQLDPSQCDAIRRLPGHEKLIGLENIPQSSYVSLLRTLARKTACPPPAVVSYWEGIPIVGFDPELLRGEQAFQIVRRIVKITQAFSPTVISRRRST